ncbi:hypothetical protein EBR96_05975 [bacterium]|nr:hypothetical protein [bacterium]
MAKIKENSNRITDFQAVSIQTTTSPFDKTPSLETGWIYRKGTATRKELQKPVRKLVIQTTDSIYEKNLQTGEETRRSLSDAPNFPVAVPMKPVSQDPAELMAMFNMQIRSESTEQWVLEGYYGDFNIQISVSKSPAVATRVSMTNLKSGMSLLMENSYQTFDGIAVLVKSKSTVKMNLSGQSTEMTTSTQYNSVKINQNLNDNLFEIPTGGIDGV